MTSSFNGGAKGGAAEKDIKHGTSWLLQRNGNANRRWWEALWPDPAMVLNQVGIRAGMTVIDLCSGDGWFTLQIAKIAGHVVAVDIDADLLDVAKLRLAESGLTNSDFVEGRAYDVAKLVPRAADFVFLANAHAKRTTLSDPFL